MQDKAVPVSPALQPDHRAGEIRKQFDLPDSLEGMLALLQRRYPATHAPQNEELGRKIIVELVGRLRQAEDRIEALEDVVQP